MTVLTGLTSGSLTTRCGCTGMINGLAAGSIGFGVICASLAVGSVGLGVACAGLGPGMIMRDNAGGVPAGCGFSRTTADAPCCSLISGNPICILSIIVCEKLRTARPIPAEARIHDSTDSRKPMIMSVESCAFVPFHSAWKTTGEPTSSVATSDRASLYAKTSQV